MMSGAEMRAVVLRQFGPPSVLLAADVPAPLARFGEVVIAVEIANITFVETQVRAGRPPHPSMAPALPAILGNGVGGTVEAVGDGVDAALVGKRVVATTGGSGGYAERSTAPVSGVFALPEGLGLAEAVAVLADGRTAVGLMAAARVAAGETVLVEAAAGGVGTLLVQLTRAVGGRVVAVAGGERKVEKALSLGADVAVDSSAPDWADRVREQIGGVDVVFDSVGGTVGRAAFTLVRRGGRFSRFGMASGTFTFIGDDEAATRQVTLLAGARPTPERSRALTQTALDEAAVGRLSPVIGQTFPLERAADAHAAIEARETIGKTLLIVDGPPTGARPPTR